MGLDNVAAAQNADDLARPLLMYEIPVTLPFGSKCVNATYLNIRLMQ